MWKMPQIKKKEKIVAKNSKGIKNAKIEENRSFPMPKNLASYDLPKRKKELKFTFVVTQGESVIQLIDASVS